LLVVPFQVQVLVPFTDIIMLSLSLLPLSS
jgi:hypothetical protein